MKRALGVFLYAPEKQCPRCGSAYVHRTRRGRLLEFWVLLFIPIRPYRCSRCYLRFYGKRHYEDAVSSGQIIVPPSEKPLT